LLSDSKQTYADVLSADADYLSDFLIGEVLEPEQDNRTIEGLEFGDALVEHVHLARVLVAILKKVDVHRESVCGLASLLPVDRYTGVEGNAINPRLDVASMLEAREAFP
jgi:hypothetical protein